MSKRIILRKLKALNTIWHPESTLVFKSQLDRVVTGRYVDKEFIPLDEEALDLCVEYNFKYDKSLVESEGEEESNEEEETKEEDEETKEEEETKEVKKSLNKNVEIRDVDENGNEIEEPETTSEEPETTSEEPETTSEEPETTSEEPETTSEEPETTESIINEATSRITNDFNTTLSNVFRIIKQLHIAVDTYKHELLRTRGVLENKCREYEELKTKFDGIKTLFSN